MGGNEEEVWIVIRLQAVVYLRFWISEKFWMDLWLSSVVWQALTRSERNVYRDSPWIPHPIAGGLARRTTTRLAGWLAGWLTGWLAGWLADWPPGEISHKRFYVPMKIGWVRSPSLTTPSAVSTISTF